MSRTYQIGLLLATLLIAGEVRGQDWGGTSLRTAADMDVVTLHGQSTTLNFGTATTVSLKATTAPTVERVGLFRMATDPHTAGYTQDVCTLFVYYEAASSDPDADADTLMVYGYVMRRDWNEGNENIATADSGDCDWSAAMTKSDASDSIAWGDVGAQNTTSDRQATVACSTKFVNATAAGYIPFVIAGTHLTQDFFDYGIILQIGWADALNETMVFSADENLEAQRPYFNGWESPATGSALSVGPVKLGVTKLGP